MKEKGKPFSGQTILITRSELQALPFVRVIESKGGEAVVIPLLSFQPPQEPGEIRKALHQMEQYDWVVFTSQNTVRYVLNHMKEENLPLSRLNRCKVGAIGKKTMNLLEDQGVQVDFQPSQFVAEQFVKEFVQQTEKGDRILLPQGNLARSTIEERLSEAGRRVTSIIAYETVANEAEKTRLNTVIQEKMVNIVTFTSSSSVRFFFELLEEEIPLDGIRTACIGPITANTLEEYGHTADIIAQEYTIDGLVHSIESYLLKEEKL
ncbi:uroporphyrinogen-III synthase [Pseudalkalibacillus sp. SCS-8]|uniref:uroporphyrinogen-III synthase n=1 Tax=Pseudalkalibacillus nanhaiensis TaxID=3115291 RepID=UPI0032DAD15F